MAHNWRPIPNWHGRYRCQECYCLGFKKIAVGEGNMSRIGLDDGVEMKRSCETGDVVPYKCSKQGCNRNAAIWVKRARHAFCSDHEPKRKTNRTVY